MPNAYGDNNGNRIEALRKREAALRAAIAAEKVKEQKRREKEYARLYTIVGTVEVGKSEKSPEYKARLIREIQGAEMSDGDRAFLVRMGWL